MAAPTPPRSTPLGRARLVVLFGGRSAEHDVSCVSAAHVIAAVDRDRYELDAIGITRQGGWVRNEAAAAPLPVDGTEAAAITAEGAEVDPLPALVRTDPGLPVVVLPLLHGPHGEDGTVQGLLELADVPYVGSGVLGSAVCMDKVMAKVVADASGLPQCAWRSFTAVEPAELIRATVVEELGFPCFVKPANLGSSVGITKAHDPAELDRAIALAFTYDDHVVVEEGVDGREIEVAVLGNVVGAEPPRASVPGEIVPGAEFYDYDDKYAAGAAELRVPAPLTDAQADEARALAVRAFTALRCDGMARVDFFYEDGGRGWLLNEINTIPGFTPISMYPKLWEATGLGYSDLIDELVRLAVERHARRAAFSTKH